MQQTHIETVGDLAREVRALFNSDQKWLFRGQADACWELLPSVHRGYSRQQERYLTNEFRVRARSRYPACPGNNDYPGWLALMQHYGLPTRLLDWTYSPLVAAFFAVHPDYAAANGEAGRDACIWVLSPGALNQTQGFEPLIFPLDAASYQPLIAPAFKNRDEPETVGVAMAIEHDARIQLQQGAFTVHSCRTPLNRLTGSDALLHKLVIPHEAVPSFMDDLSLLGMRKSNLFPDLASLTSELKAIHPPESGLHDGAAAGGHAQVLDLGGTARRTRYSQWQEDIMERKRRVASVNDETADKAGARRDGLENLNVTRPASPPPAGHGGDDEPDDGLENLDVTRQSAPDSAAGKTA